MGKLEVGDRVYNGGFYATVVECIDLVRIQWDAPTLVEGTWPAKVFRKVERAFEKGQFVRVIETGEVGIIFEDDGDPEDEAPYTVGIFGDDEEEDIFSSDELIPWIPHVGERVLESADVDSDEVGTVLAFNGRTARVLWDDYALAQDFPIEELEPADEYEVDFEVGDTVEYRNPVFAGPIEATIIGFDDEGLRVRFTRDFLPEGNYSKDSFTKAA